MIGSRQEADTHVTGTNQVDHRGVLLLVLIIASIGMATDFELTPDQDEPVKAAAPQPTTMISEDQAKAAALAANPAMTWH
jgi:hypothetical protein